jgi:hypothetical protein
MICTVLEPPRRAPGALGLTVGVLVGSRRWPMAHAHPGCWLPPWSGILLAQNDLRAWQGTLAFPRDVLLTQAAVDHHVAWCHGEGLLRDRWPVLWAFNQPRVWWESDLRPYALDLADWDQARAAAFAERSRSRV